MEKGQRAMIEDTYFLDPIHGCCKLRVDIKATAERFEFEALQMLFVKGFEAAKCQFDNQTSTSPDRLSLISVTTTYSRFELSCRSDRQF